MPEYLRAKSDIKINAARIRAKDNTILYSEEGNITISSSDINVKGIIYATNGIVTINAANFSFDGVIYAKEMLSQKDGKLNTSIFDYNVANKMTSRKKELFSVSSMGSMVINLTGPLNVIAKILYP